MAAPAAAPAGRALQCLCRERSAASRGTAARHSGPAVALQPRAPGKSCPGSCRAARHGRDRNSAPCAAKNTPGTRQGEILTAWPQASGIDCASDRGAAARSVVAASACGSGLAAITRTSSGSTTSGAATSSPRPPTQGFCREPGQGGNDGGREAHRDGSPVDHQLASLTALAGVAKEQEQCGARRFRGETGAGRQGRGRLDACQGLAASPGGFYECISHDHRLLRQAAKVLVAPRLPGPAARGWLRSRRPGPCAGRPGCRSAFCAGRAARFPAPRPRAAG